MEIADLEILQGLAAHYAQKGITTLYPPQAECVQKGLLSGNNLLIAIPTASGKTLVAEMAMHRHLQNRGKCLYIVPLRALASEKYDEFNNKGVKVGIATGDFDRRDEYLEKNDIIVATSEKVDSLLRNRSSWLDAITLLVVDEVHLIDSPDRGPTLEMVITKLRHRNPGMQVLALSATIGNPKPLASWLSAELVTSEWRPVDLKEGVYSNGTIYFSGSERVVPRPSKNEDLNLCLDTIAEGGQCLVFVSSRKNAEAFARRAAAGLKQKGQDPALAADAKKIASAAETDMGRLLAACVERGAAFHHAGLKKEERAIIEAGFRDGRIKVIASTPTLAAGLNLPARRVVIRDYYRYSAGEGMRPIPVREYRQMAGRAGRPHLDPYGEAVLLAKNEEEVADLFCSYIDAPAEDIFSQCARESVLYTHILSLIAAGFVRREEELRAFMQQTFYASLRESQTALQRVVDRVLSFLQDAEMIVRVGEWLEATEYGALVSRLYIDPKSAEMITRALRERTKEGYTDIGFLHLLCSTPDMLTLYLRKNDAFLLDRFLTLRGDELWLDCAWDEMEEFQKSLKTAMLLSDWTEELSEENICERYGVGPGDIYGMVEGANWLIHASAQLARMVAPGIAGPIAGMEIRAKHGIKSELLPLVRLHGVGRVRARRLFNNGITGPEEILAAGPGRVGQILGHGVAEQIFAQLKGGKRGKEDDDPVSLLMRLPGIGKARALRLVENGLDTPDAIIRAGVERVAGIVGRSAAERIFEELEEEEQEQAAGQATLFRFGRVP